jgi:signal transduction histidine kinase
MPKNSTKNTDFSDSSIASLQKKIKQLADKLRACEAESFQLKNLIDNLPGDIYWKDREGFWSGLNKRCVHSLFRMGFIKKIDAAEVIGKTDYEIFNVQTADGYRQNDLEVMHNKGEITREETTDLPNGEKVTLFSTKTPLWDINNNVAGIVGNTVDISYLKKIETSLIIAKEEAEAAAIAMKKAEAQALVAQTKAAAEEEMRKTVMVLVGDIVHDLRTPIATVRMVGNFMETMLPILIEIIEESKQLGAQKLSLLNKKKWDYLVEMTPVMSLQNSVILMDDFINTTLIELSTAQKIHPSELTHEDLTMCSSRRVIENTLEAYLIPKHIVIHQQIGYDFFFKGNSILMMKILFNLIKNAIDQIDLNDKGDITITTEDGGESNLIKIKDSAGGAPPDVVANLFTGYFTTKENGTGIGLAYCKKTMNIFGGSISCQSVFGESMEFILSFPKVDYISNGIR